MRAYSLDRPERLRAHLARARRLYEVTPEGVEFLHSWAVRARLIRRRLEQFTAQYEAFFDGTEAEED